MDSRPWLNYGRRRGLGFRGGGTTFTPSALLRNPCASPAQQNVLLLAQSQPEKPPLFSIPGPVLCRSAMTLIPAKHRMHTFNERSPHFILLPLRRKLSLPVLASERDVCRDCLSGDSRYSNVFRPSLALRLVGIFRIKPNVWLLSARIKFQTNR